MVVFNEVFSMTPNAISQKTQSPLIRNSLSGLGRIRLPSERAGEITEEEMRNHVKNDWNEEDE